MNSSVTEGNNDKSNKEDHSPIQPSAPPITLELIDMTPATIPPPKRISTEFTPLPTIHHATLTTTVTGDHRFDPRELSAHLKEVAAASEKAGDIGWYIEHKRALIRQQYQAQAAARRDGFITDELTATAVIANTGSANSVNEVNTAAASSHHISASSSAATSVASPGAASRGPIFHGVVAWVNGLTNPSADVLKSLLYTHGGQLENKLIPGVTHWIAESLPRVKVKEILSNSKHKPVVHPSWIMECIKQGKRLPEQEFLIVQRPAIRKLQFGQVTSSTTPTSAVTTTGSDLTLPMTPTITKTVSLNAPASTVTDGASTAASPFAAPKSHTPTSSRRRSATKFTSASKPTFSFDALSRAPPPVPTISVPSPTPPSLPPSTAAPSSIAVTSNESNLNESARLEVPASTHPSSEANQPAINPSLHEQTDAHKSIDTTVDEQMQIEQDLDEDDDDDAALIAALEAAEQQQIGAAATTTTITTPTATATIQPINPPLSTPNATTSAIVTLASSTISPPASSTAASSSSSPAPSSIATPAGLQTAAKLGFHVHARSTLTDPNFVEKYFQQSRLHFLGSWKKHFETLLPSLLAIKPKYEMKPNSAAGSLAGFFQSSTATASATNQQRVIMHIDMDCFFVSASIRDEPDLADKPVAICHSSGQPSSITGQANGIGSSSISSASYAARAFGIRAETQIADALQLCPQLIVKPYEFEKYIAISEEVYQIFFSYTHTVESVSCDEAYLEFPPGTNGYLVAEQIRADILKQTRCPCSAGIGPNMLLARLATTKAKPAKSFEIVSRESAMDFLKELPLSTLQGVGHVLLRKLRELHLETCGDLHNATITKQWLQQQFGVKTGEMLWQYSHGIDHRTLQCERVQRSISADVNYGLRFIEPEAVNAFIYQVCTEVVKRLRVYRLKGYCITVKAMKRSADEPMEPTWKFLGHGRCDSYSKSIQVKTAQHGNVSCIPIMARYVMDLYMTFKIIPHDLRGFGISITNLEEDTTVTNSTVKPTSISPDTSSGRVNDVDQHRRDSATVVVGSRVASSTAVVSPEKMSKYSSNALSAASFMNESKIIKQPSIGAAAESNDSIQQREASAPHSPFLAPRPSTSDVTVVPTTATENRSPPTNPSLLERSVSGPIEKASNVNVMADGASMDIDNKSVANSGPFIFDPVVKAARLEEDLRHFPTFALLDKDMIASLPPDLRKDLADIYKIKRAKEVETKQPPSASTALLPQISRTGSIDKPPSTRSTEPVTTILRATAPTPHDTMVDLAFRNVTVPLAPPAPPVPPARTTTQLNSLPGRSSSNAHSVTSSNSISGAVVNDLEWSQIDHAVLAELPDSIRRELKNEAKRKKQAQLVTLATNVVNKKRKEGPVPPVKVLNIAAHFKQMEKKQKRSESSSRTSSPIQIISPLTVPDSPISVHSPTLPATTTGSAPLVQQLPSLLDQPIRAQSPTIDSDNVTVTTTAGGGISTVLPSNDMNESALYPKGFLLINPRWNPERYGGSNSTDANPSITESAQVSVTTDSAAPTVPLVSILPTHAPTMLSQIPEDGPVAMDIDSDSSPTACVKKENDMDDSHIIREELVEDDNKEVTCIDPSILQMMDAPIVDQIAPPHPDVPQSDEAPPIVADSMVDEGEAAAAAEEEQEEKQEEAEAIIPDARDLSEGGVSVDDQVIVDEDEDEDVAPLVDGQSMVEPFADVSSIDASTHLFESALSPDPPFEAFDQIQFWLHDWVIFVATPPTHDHQELLIQFCRSQLEFHHNSEVVYALLSELRLLASGDWKLKNEHERTQMKEVWQQPFNHILKEIQVAMRTNLGGRLALEPFKLDL